MRLAIESRKQSSSAAGDSPKNATNSSSNGGATPLMHHRKSAYTMLKDEFMSTQVKKVLDYLGRLETKHLRDTDPDRRGRSTGLHSLINSEILSTRN